MLVSCECGTRLRIADNQAGKKFKCPKCGAVLDAPGAPPVPAAGITSAPPLPSPLPPLSAPEAPPRARPSLLLLFLAAGLGALAVVNVLVTVVFLILGIRASAQTPRAGIEASMSDLKSVRFIRDNNTEQTETDWLQANQPYSCHEIGRQFGTERQLRLLMVALLEPLLALFRPGTMELFFKLQAWAEDERLEMDSFDLYGPGGPLHGHGLGLPSGELGQVAAHTLVLNKVGAAPPGVSMAHPSHKAWNQAYTETLQAIQADQAALMRCIYGNPFRTPPSLDPAWLTTTVVPLAQSIYEDRAFDRLDILADALEEAGCRNAEMLGHCRETGPHARGCWVVDLILSKDR